MAYPKTRMRRLRVTAGLRGLVRETELSPGRLMLPLFVVDAGSEQPSREPIASMPGVERLSISAAITEAAEAAAAGIAAVMLFGVPAEKDEHGSGAWDDEGVVQVATRAIKQAQPDLLVITDVCLCEYTTHGHCGVLREDGTVENDATVELLARTAVSHARAGADIAAPSFGDRRGYQMDPANGREAVREALLDLQEGADMVMVKPALAYGDLIRSVKRATRLPVAAYNVSGEYAMVMAAAAAGYLDERATVLEILTSLRRAGADTIITYHAKDAARWLAEQT